MIKVEVDFKVVSKEDARKVAGIIRDVGGWLRLDDETVIFYDSYNSAWYKDVNATGDSWSMSPPTVTEEQAVDAIWRDRKRVNRQGVIEY